MSKIEVNLAEMKTSTDASDVLVARSLGSCIALAAYDPTIRVGGLLLYVLPISKIDTKKARTMPFMFADTGIPRLFRAMYDLGAKKERIVVKLAGGSQVMGDSRIFDMGKRNYMILRKIFLKNKVEIASEHVGGNISRNLLMKLDDGKCLVQFQGKEEEL